MEVKLTIVVLVALTLLVNDLVVADFFFNHRYKPWTLLPDDREYLNNSTRYNCVPGRTIIKVTEKTTEAIDVETDSDEFMLRSGPTRKTHMNFPTKDEHCRICVCSVDGMNEYCSNRPAENVNECIVMKNIMEKFNMGLPYEHTRDLSFRMRRDYLWHNDEIPYDARAKCFRGHSYYSNSVTANNTDVDVASDIESLLDYNNEFTCYYCVCSVDGNSVGCIHRDVSFCNFFRVIRSDKNVRDRYTSLLQQDRPSYFRLLSYRMRRTMDNGIYDLINAVNEDTPPNKKCLPFISEYSNCNDENLCSGCTRCTCDADGEWSCKEVKVCNDYSADPPTPQIEEQDEIFENALNMLEYELENKKLKSIRQSGHPNVPGPQVEPDPDSLLDSVKNYRMDEILSVLTRPKRSIDKKIKKHTKRSVDKASHRHAKSLNSSNNNTIKFYDAVDELNEDTLKDSNVTGTLIANKMDLKPQLSGTRRLNEADNSSKALQIEFNQPKTYNPITDNKIEGTEHDIKFDSSHENLKSVLGNYTQKVKDKDLSKIVVNELKKGSEVIGDASAPVTSNITFTPENDTLTAMAFIAGNLLNKLWNMEKDATASSMETDAIKHEKITDLLDLFKEPLNLRQETFLKNALEQLSSALDKNKDIKNISLCDNIHEAKKMLYDTNSTSDEEKPNSTAKPSCKQDKKEDIEDVKQKKATVKAIAKINNVLDLIKKFENIQGSLSELKHGPKLVFNKNYTKTVTRTRDIDSGLTKDEKYSLNLFGKLLEKITKLIMPKRNGKKIVNVIKSQNLLISNDNLKKRFKKMYNIDLSNMTVTAKDKLILDYLTHVDDNPDCLMKTKKKLTEGTPSLEGNILLNLSEFFKMKSFSDLIKLLEPENQKDIRPPFTSANQVLETTTSYGKQEFVPNFRADDNNNDNKFNSTKEKLKAHLKTIIEDLIELQNAKGLSVKGNIKIADALPCIYNVLNAGKDEIVAKKEEKIDSIKKIGTIFNELKKEIKIAQSRRSIGDVVPVRPKSAVVWSRLVTNLDRANINTRRSIFHRLPKSFDKIREMMENIENGSSTYKHYALLVKVPPAGKLMLLKALEQEVQTTIRIIEDIKLSFDNLSKLPADKFNELTEFIGNMASGLSLSEKVNDKIKPELRKFFVNEINSSKLSKGKLKKKNILKLAETASEEIDEMKVSRAQVINQLIRNRVQQFLKTKEESEFDVHNDMAYNVAQRILYYLDSGNDKLAYELYKVFILQKQNKPDLLSGNDPANDKYFATSTSKLNDGSMRRMASYQREVPFEDPGAMKAKQMNWVNQDHLIKQLLNMKNMGLS